MNFSGIIADKTPELFIKETLSSAESRKLFLSFAERKQRVKVQSFLLGHNTENFTPEPVYGPTGKGQLQSRGVEGLKHDGEILAHFASAAGQQDITEFVSEVIQSLKESIQCEKTVKNLQSPSNKTTLSFEK